ncbi:hypothetical protein C0991_008036 [Blastosporella zonata]|nr:hypothetical protein C0991_008036 [Blastosporella zonata]
MVAVIRVLAASATLVFGVLPVLADPTPAPISPVEVINPLIKRSSPSVDLDGVPANCQDVCKASNEKTSSCTTDKCICDDSKLQAFGKCLSCVVTSPNPPVDKTTAQEAIDAVTKVCDQEGLKVNDVKLGSGAIRPTMVNFGALVGIALGTFVVA